MSIWEDCILYETQKKKIVSNQKVDNNIDLSDLSGIEINTLKEVFSQISTFQSKLKCDFGIKE